MPRVGVAREREVRAPPQTTPKGEAVARAAEEVRADAAPASHQAVLILPGVGGEWGDHATTTTYFEPRHDSELRGTEMTRISRRGSCEQQGTGTA